MDFLTYGLQKTWLVECLRSPVSEDPLTSNIKNGRNIVEISRIAPLPYLLIHVKEIQVEKVSLSDMQNVTIVY